MSKDNVQAGRSKWRDRLWKDGLSKLADDAVEFFMPGLAADRDTGKPIMAIVGPELQAPSSKSDKGMRVPDVFISVPVTNKRGAGDVALFVEQQHERDRWFAKRVCDTYTFLRVRHEKVTALVIFTGKAKGVGEYSESFYGTSLDFRFNTYSVRDVEPDMLRADGRVFANIALAARLALDAGASLARREQGARELLDIVSGRNYSDRKKGLILNFASGVFRVDDAGIDAGLKEAYKVWKKIPMDEYIKRVELENAREEGEEIGIAKGVAKGRAEGVAEGAAKGRAEGVAEGRAEGMLEVARKLLSRNATVDEIAEITGMDKRQILALG
ncbi:MAG: hypothetical protein LBR38_06160 [Synergistaceae bacterium]|jgi:hypothetical protein|nr:hypothetical protein [Synergistaceae bacterium]